MPVISPNLIPLDATLAEHPEPIWVCDVDSTLIGEETLDYLAMQVLDEREFAGFKAVTDACMGGVGMGFYESFSRRVEVLKQRGVTREQVYQVGHELIRRIDASAHDRKGHILAIRHRLFAVSGGVEDLIMPSMEALGLKSSHVHANQLTYDERGIVSGFEDRLTVHDDGKAQQVEALGLDGYVIGIGDGNNDLLIREAGGVQHFVAYAAHKQHERVVAAADSVADSFTPPILN